MSQVLTLEKLSKLRVSSEYTPLTDGFSAAWTTARLSTSCAIPRIIFGAERSESLSNSVHCRKSKLGSRGPGGSPPGT